KGGSARSAPSETLRNRRKRYWINACTTTVPEPDQTRSPCSHIRCHAGTFVSEPFLFHPCLGSFCPTPHRNIRQTATGNIQARVYCRVYRLCRCILLA